MDDNFYNKNEYRMALKYLACSKLYILHSTYMYMKNCIILVQIWKRSNQDLPSFDVLLSSIKD